MRMLRAFEFSVAAAWPWPRWIAEPLSALLAAVVDFLGFDMEWSTSGATTLPSARVADNYG
jgi:hypothetical protein